MPAMSPTMEKGGIVDWKVKDGESFKSGDVLLEIETDKAQIDVEAQDDGVMAKIVAANGDKDIPVGKTIAYLAEPEDDLATLELPKEDIPEAKPEPKTDTKSDPQEKTRKHVTSGSNSTEANAAQELFPSVVHLLGKNNITKETALKEIKATGPKGRLLKGDVLVYLGKISQESLDSVTLYIANGEHLHLEGVEKVKFTEPGAATDKKQKDSTAPAKEVKEPLVLKHSFDLAPVVNLQAESAGKVKPFSVAEFVQEASRKAEAYALKRHPVKSDYYDELFEDILAVPNDVVRFTTDINVNYANKPVAASPPSIFDVLAGVATSNTSTSGSDTVDVAVHVNEKVADAEEKASLYITKLGEYLELRV